MGLGARFSAVILNTVLVLAALPASGAHDLAPPIRVTVGGNVAYVAEGTTVGQALGLYGLRPRPGSLVSVTGRVLKASIVSGAVTVDGVAAAPQTPLSVGAIVAIVDGRNRREPLRAEIGAMRVASSPLYRLPSGYGWLARRWLGAISGEVLREEVVTDKGAVVPPAVALTFDDGPDPRWTPQILAILNRYGVKGTFFVTGENAAAYGWVVRQLIASGMSVQNHSWSHERLARFGPRGVRLRLAPVQNVLARLGVRPRWFRPPYGSYSRSTLRGASSIGLRTAMWSLDTYDWRRPSSSTIARRALTARPGEVILMHDGGGNRASTVGAIGRIIEELRRRGFRFVVLT